MIGKQIRLERIFDRESRSALIVPMDHGMSEGPLPGIIDIRDTIDKVSHGGATAIVIHKGLVEFGHRGHGKDIGLIVHISASTRLSPTPNSKVLVAGVEEGIQLGADGISIHVNIGAEDDAKMLEDAGRVVRDCRNWGMPLLAMMYPRGKDIRDPYDVDLLRHVARVGAELGADVVKVNYTGDESTFHEVVKACPAPVLIAGGPKLTSDREVLGMAKGAMNAGARGISIGRNIWQHRDPVAMTSALSQIVFRNGEVEDAMKLLG
ncbi:MAG: 2-amino-3,7-dideoxy-D-threo-hept-6-ulosonate synthase [Thermoplasmata archaeon]|uniref:2-amino-3,7-dideoxy-D-threo-hept-6-ulosonate synthase n=1 Tax=Candidatus Sysuiplasma superficiale TaxID=2823368 RepID=A0A8J8CCS0_9ARCH|nr:2-amino-3,7-dideoxy-D-threo-hept-6-ulosonate synthase [Candidatus Sysuiplasma superficiale]MBX8643839.1 2-amino-3,7-dideoxy-D-threo-hept-6-ulosonate synthase [Candidatus Sysuiplasma superficiale]MCL4346649.1 2-amino-3,7-dideoxy-D-threo-hept-6-ulosonate synthase [Candidatus Thermoplasmatota archaeon]